MRKIFVLVFGLLIFIIAVFFAVSAFAQTEEQTNAQVDKFTTCLKNRVDPVTGKTIPDSFALTWHDPPSPQSLTKYLTGNFTPNSTVYAIACRGSGTGRICSTGNKANDDYLFFSDLQIQNSTGQTIIINEAAPANTDLTKQIHVRFYNMGTNIEGSKQQADEKGVVNYDTIVSGTTADSGAYSFYGIQIVIRNDIAYGYFEEAGQKQGTFGFDPPETAESDCAKISWTHYDPYGIVFDAKSLEPIPGVKVTILDKNGKKVEFPGFVNDIPTKEDGLFNYSVQPGEYILVISPPPNYKFEQNPPIHPNANSLYIFTDTNGSRCTIYKPDEIIKEIIDTPEEQFKKAPQPECRNIPLTPLSTPYVAKEVVSMFYEFTKNSTDYIFNGKVSHPLTYVGIFQNKQELGGQKTNNSGFYNIKIPITTIAQDSPIEITFTKTNLTATIINLFPFLKPVLGATVPNKIIVDPILSYLEGYAYDSNEDIIPNAIVKLRLKETSGTYFQTEADKNGYFSVAPRNIPPMEYYLEFVSPLTNKAFTYKTYEFAKANREYLETNSINLVAATKNGIEIFPSGSKLSEKNSGTDSVGNDVSGNNNQNAKKTSSNLPVIFGLIITLFILFALTLFVLIKRKNNQSHLPFP